MESKVPSAGAPRKEQKQPKLNIEDDDWNEKIPEVPIKSNEISPVKSDSAAASPPAKVDKLEKKVSEPVAAGAVEKPVVELKPKVVVEDPKVDSKTKPVVEGAPKADISKKAEAAAPKTDVKAKVAAEAAPKYDVKPAPVSTAVDKPKPVDALKKEASTTEAAKTSIEK